MKRLEVKISKQTGFAYLNAKEVKQHIDALEKQMELIIERNYQQTLARLPKPKKIDVLSRLHQIRTMIPLTTGKDARKEIKKLIDEIKC